MLTNGASLVGQLLKIALDKSIAVWTEAPLEDLIVEDGRVVGVRTVRDGAPVNVRARKGVLISAGGFAHNRAMRARVQRRPAQRRQVVDVEPGRHRRGDRNRDGASARRPR